MFIPKLEQDEPISREQFNRLVDRANSRIKSVVSASIHDSQLGMSITPGGSIQPIYGALVDRGRDEDHPEYYEFREVFLSDETGQWEEKEGGYRSEYNGDAVPKVINGAVEVNGVKQLPLDMIVKLTPAPRLSTDNQGRTWRNWYFDSANQVRAFVLSQDLIPTGGGDPDLSVEGYFLDDPVCSPQTFYPAHPSAFEHSEVLSLGIGRKAGHYTTGTKGWAQWVDRAIAEVVEDRIVWHGEWQIVTLYASLIAEVRIYGALIKDGATGEADLWWMDTDDEVQVSGDEDFALLNSTYRLKVTNTTGATLIIGERLTVQFDRHDYRWYPLKVVDRDFYGEVEAGFTNDDGDTSHAVSVKACEWDGGGVGVAFDVFTPIKANMDTNLFTGDVVTYRVMSDGTKVITSDIWEQPIGTVVWEVMDVLKIRNDRGWWLCNGANGTRDWSGRFAMCIDEGGFAGVGAYGGEDTLNIQAGFREHGQTGNNHTTHTAAEIGDHAIAAVLACVGNHTGAQVAASLADHTQAQVVACIAHHPALVHSASTGTDFALDPEGMYDDHPVRTHQVAGGADLVHATGGNLAHVAGAGPALTHSVLQHDGPYNVNTDTDNRPRYGVYAARQYTGVA